MNVFRFATAPAGFVGGGSADVAAQPAAADAKKRREERKRCKRQVGACRSRIRDLCAGDPTCLESVSCCEKLRVCKFDHFLTCLVANGAS